MNTNIRKICPSGIVPSKSDGIITVQIVKDESAEYKLLDKPLGLAIIELGCESKPDDPKPKFEVVWCNDYHSERFSNLKGSICYKEVNKFDFPCKWCPVRNTFMDGLIHMSLAASPIEEDFPNITYSQIVSIPYAYDDNGIIRQVLEMVFDFRDEQLKQFSESLDEYILSNRIGDLLMAGGHRSEMADLLLLGFMLGLSDDAGIAHCFLFPKGYRDLKTAEVIEHHRLTNENIHPDLRNQLLHTGKDFLSASKIRGMVMSPVVPESKGKLIADMVEKEEKNLLPNDPWLPTRLGHRKLGILVPNLDAETDCFVILEKVDRNDLLFENALSIAALLISAFRRVLTIRETTAKYNVIRRNLEDKLDMFRQAEGKIISLIPFVLGKSHDLGRIITKQKILMHTISNLPIAEKTGSVKEDLLRVLEYTTARLSFLREGMKSISVLKEPHFREVDIVELIKDVWSLFSVQFHDDKISAKVKGPMYDFPVDCDPELMEQVFFNLTDNACKALRRVKGIPKTIEVKIKQTEKGVEITFWDNGGGIDVNDEPYIFNMYFSTNPHGTGLGLYFCKVIIEDVHKGTLTVENRWGKFARFRIFLPE